MIIENNNITVTAGDDNSMLFRFSDYKDIVAEGIDLYFTVKKYTDKEDTDDNAVFQTLPEDITYQDYIDDSGEESVTYTNAIAVIKTSDSTKRIPCGTYKYDLQKVQGGVSTIMSGSYTVQEDVTKTN